MRLPHSPRLAAIIWLALGAAACGNLSPPSKPKPPPH
jgi:hypothetical protein